MQQALVIDFPKKRRKAPVNAGKKGRVYSRGNKLWVDFYYMEERIREPAGLLDTPTNRKMLRNQLDLVLAEIENGVFIFAERFKTSKKKEYFTKLEGRTFALDPGDLTFGEYLDAWWKDMKPGMTVSQKRDYTSILKVHLKPNFGKLAFSEITPTVMKKFVAKLKSRKVRGKAISAKRIQNIMIPLRVIAKDAIAEYNWDIDPFKGVKLPKVRKTRVHPFSYKEWAKLMEYIPDWYKPYFSFAVQTGLRPSEQVALKWSAIDDEYVHIELSRVKNYEKSELKTAESRRSIALRPEMKRTLEKQKALTAHIESPYVFLNLYGRVVLQDKMRENWMRVMKKSGLKYRRMYECRHTFASWALAAGETPEWVARTLGHVDTSMVYSTYGRYIPNLTRRDGTAFEKQLSAQAQF